MPSWINWAGNQQSKPVRIERPASELEVVEVVRRAVAEHLRVKVVGSGHSFTGIAVPDEVMIDLTRLNRVVNVDHTRGVITVQAGIVLSDLNAY